jgi:hypothetical protein
VKTHPEFRAQTITEYLRVTGGAVGSSLNLQPMLVRSSGEMDWSVRVRQPVIPREDIRSHKGIEVSNVWCYTCADPQPGMEGGDKGKTHLRSGRKSEL